MKIKLVIEYQGEAFRGWQLQPGLVTVQGSLEAALKMVFRGWAKKQGQEWESDRVEVTGSGRTDAGVHARAQVASFVWPARFEFDHYRVLSALNALTPRQMSILSVEQAPDDFDARFTPHLKCYRYTMLLRAVGPGYSLNRAWPISPNMDVAAMARAARHFVGVHDFSSFRARDCSAQTTVRTILLSEVARGERDELHFTVQGKGFLKQMIRIMTGTLVEVGAGRMAPEDIIKILAAKTRVEAGQTAPAAGLTMEWVRYLDAPYEKVSNQIVEEQDE